MKVVQTWFVIPALLSVCCLLGCGERVSNNAPADQAEATKSGKDDPGASNSGDQKSVAVSDAPQPAAFDATPEGVARKFMDLLQSGNRLEAESLLTRISLSNITDVGLKLEPMGGPQAKFTIGDAIYATNRKKLAHVECTIRDHSSGQAEEMKISWQAKIQGEQWRISGVILEVEEAPGFDLLSFENPFDVQKIQALATAEALDAGPAQRQADGSNGVEIK